MLSQWKPWAGFEATGLASRCDGWWQPGNLENRVSNYLWCILIESRGGRQLQEG